MMTMQGCHKNEPAQADRLVASLKAHAELVRQLIQDIETDNMGPEAAKYRVLEIKNSCRQLAEAS